MAPSVEPAPQFRSTSTVHLPDGDVDMVHGPEVEGTVPSLQPTPESQSAATGRLTEGDIGVIHGLEVEVAASINLPALEPHSAAGNRLLKGDIMMVNNPDFEDGTISVGDPEDFSCQVPPNECSRHDSRAKCLLPSSSPCKELAQHASPPRPSKHYHMSSGHSSRRSRSPYRGRYLHPCHLIAPRRQLDHHKQHLSPSGGANNRHRPPSPRRHFSRNRSPPLHRPFAASRSQSPRRHFTKYRPPSPHGPFVRYRSPSPLRHSTCHSHSSSTRQLPYAQSAHGWKSPIRLQPTPRLEFPPHVPPDSRRQAAIDYILSCFPPSTTLPEFCGLGGQDCTATLSTIPDHVLRHGRLAVPATTEIRLRYWRLRDPSAKLSDLLTCCLSKRLAFRISLPNTFGSARHSTLLRQFVVDTSTRLIKQDQRQKVSPTMVKEYLDNVSDVLRRPQARQLVLRGGLLSRIVQEYAPNVYAEALLGPSAAAVDQGRLELDSDGTHFTDLITPSEINMLLGLTSNHNTFWPYPEQYERSFKYNGEWTAANEAWFQKQAEAIKYSKIGCLRSGVVWRNAIRPYTPEEYSNSSKTGTLAHATACCAHLTREWPEFGDDFDFASLYNNKTTF